MSKVTDTLPVKDISVKELNELTSDQLELLGGMLFVYRDKSLTEEVPLSVVMPYYIFARIKKALDDAETLSKLVVAQTLNAGKSKLIS